MNRRRFLKSSFLSAASTLLVTPAAWALDKCKPGVAHKYVPDMPKAMKAKKFTEAELNFKNRANPRKLKTAGEMNCDNCIFYNNPKPKLCPLVPNCKLEDAGWCTMWSGAPAKPAKKG